MDSLGFNDTFSINRLYCAVDKYVAVKKSEINRSKLTMLRVGNIHNKPAQ